MESLISVCVLVFKNEDILFVRSNSQRGKLKLVLPGGNLMDNQTIEDCAIKEVKDSTGLDIKLESKLNGVIMRRNKKGNSLITFVLLAEALSPIKSNNAVFISHKVVSHYREISDFSKLVVEKVKASNLSSLDKHEFEDSDNKKYLLYF
ncbi:bifunctional nicotinamide mononucleotide adenylyltransferase/ADP-ribose pyrophosphatase [Oxobacter pfennigii]|uniref:Bifunctional nicotinamide mononucleotide adenylyltransferase/ADP-ribose pyrophosphatase n=1 Tax=Oxobacter pfennigii TaxID=36849 RepID=A0A0P8W932_9CLOT|nr:NUDIX domain-containing protein [Oxobacter pfennigii]KPU44529.1 bifunctional nicotinamide mononucleotide adenylyltransferase/ADP-ribose pyrophosphatase [Oxobacter pfennigii]